jgi:hypothetical protein
MYQTRHPGGKGHLGGGGYIAHCTQAPRELGRGAVRWRGGGSAYRCPLFFLFSFFFSKKKKKKRGDDELENCTVAYVYYTCRRYPGGHDGCMAGINRHTPAACSTTMLDARPSKPKVVKVNLVCVWGLVTKKEKENRKKKRNSPSPFRVRLPTLSSRMRVLNWCVIPIQCVPILNSK